MKKSFAATLVVGALVFGLALGSVGIAYAQTDESADRPGTHFLEVIAEVLGLTTDEVVEAKQDGQSLPRIAEDVDVTTDEIVDALLAAEIERLDSLLADDSITQEQYDWAVENAADRIEERVMSDGLRGPGMRGHGGRGPGMQGAEGGSRGQFGETGACQMAPEDVPAAPEA